MAEMNVTHTNRHLTVRHRGRISQTGIYLGKQLRMFIYQSDWKVMPMSALIAGLVGMVIRNKLFDSMEGTLMGSFALVMVCIWNGCFNSIQVICRERDVIKRQHRSGMHISSYVAAHMLYQLLLCLAQTIITLIVTQRAGVHYEKATPLVTPWFMVDFGISMLLITYASDMMSLWVSSLSRNTTTAMTIMPFVLIFQLVFSGGMLTLPEWTRPLTSFTISSPALKVMTTQANYNAMPVKTIWSTLKKMQDKEVEGTFTLGQILETLEDDENPTVAQIRAFDLSSVLDLDDDEKLKVEIPSVTVGNIVDKVATKDDLQEVLEEPIEFKFTLRQVFDLLGEKKLRDAIQTKAGEAGQNEEYAFKNVNVAGYWLDLFVFVLGFALLAMITLEFIDKDKR